MIQSLFQRKFIYLLEYEIKLLGIINKTFLTNVIPAILVMNVEIELLYYAKLSLSDESINYQD